jgi:antitoxin component HigA of HigAB toxin-antitoxin module
MKTTSKKISGIKLRFAQMPTDYRSLCCDVILPRPLHTKSEYKAALEVAEAMAGHDLTKDQDDYLDAITTFIEGWEDQHEPKVPMASPLDVLKILMQENALCGADIGKLLGVTTSMASRILCGDRQLTPKHMIALAKRFKVTPLVFMPPASISA